MTTTPRGQIDATASRERNAMLRRLDDVAAAVERIDKRKRGIDWRAVTAVLALFILTNIMGWIYAISKLVTAEQVRVIAREEAGKVMDEKQRPIIDKIDNVANDISNVRDSVSYLKGSSDATQQRKESGR